MESKGHTCNDSPCDRKQERLDNAREEGHKENRNSRKQVDCPTRRVCAKIQLPPQKLNYAYEEEHKHENQYGKTQIEERYLQGQGPARF